MRNLHKYFILLLFLFLTFSIRVFSEDNLFKKRLKEAKKGDFVVFEYNKLYSSLSVFEIDTENNRVILEEIIIPKDSFDKKLSFRDWIEKKANESTSWTMYEIDLSENKIIDTYSVSRNCFIDLKNQISITTKLLDLDLSKLLDRDRKKIGPPPPPPPASKIISETPKRQDKVDEIPKKIGPPPPPPPTSRFISETPKGQDSVYDIHKKLGPPPPPPTLPTTEFVSDTIKESESILAKDLEYLSAFIESETVSELPDDMPKLGIAEERQSISETFEDSREPLKFPEPNVITEMPEELKESKLTTEISLTETDTSEKKNFIPFITKKPKIVSVSVEETETESIKSSGTDLFNVFSSVGGTNNEKTVNKIEPFNAFSSISVKEKKKKEDKKKKKEEKGEGIEKEIQAFDDITTSKSELTGYDDSKPLPVEELPADKDSLYQELIALEGRRYSLEKNFKEIEKSFNTGAISDFEHTKQKVELNLKLEEITSRINKIRRVISSL